MYDRICQSVDRNAQEIIAWRRDFHRHAEIAMLEMRTASLVASRLASWGYSVSLGESVCDMTHLSYMATPEQLESHYQRALGENPATAYLEQVRNGATAVIGLLDCGEGPVVGLHCELDAVPVTESTRADYRPVREGFASIHPGMAHTCGHDANLAAMLGCAKALSEVRDHLHGKVKFIFKPADERGQGAAMLIPKGHLDGVDYLFSTHLFGRELGVPGADIMSNFPETLATGRMEAVFRGKASSPTAHPQLCKNVITAMGTAITNLQSIPRHGEGVTRVQVLHVHAGEKRGGVPEEGVMEISYAGQTMEIRRFLEDYALRIFKASAEMHGVTCDVHQTEGFPPILSDAELAERMESVANAHVPGVCVRYVPHRTLYGTDDFVYMMEKVREHGGLATDTQQISDVQGIVHTGEFDYDESVIPKTAKVFAATVYDLPKQAVQEETP